MIRLATEADIKPIMMIVKKTIAMMQAENNLQWDETYPSYEVFENDIRRNELYVFEADMEVLGFICISPETDDEYATIEWASKQRATVIHRCAVSTKSRSQGIASQLFAFAEQKAVTTSQGYLKSDTYVTNEKMRAFFAKKDYDFKGIMKRPELPFEFYCYDKQL
ncbi:GNAT family N-acetyltransferase [Brochothrix campestris]|uniref:Acetyltransferase n=1 Tax=Brochothrix campestris FSL F6-1037 TaxID=1265861 RepID=W7CUM8_9LIST|nr:GNAT family N-acetyltransferase [Brochothrix campestris]EUJ40355.1 acetyltransferase [Brochothrix campestris FSL F6-1037]